MKRFLAALIISCPAWANMNLAPMDFNVGNARAVFVDFSKAVYKITFDTKNQVASVKSEIRFHANHAGRPIFDLIPTPRNLVIDGQSVSQREISLPENVSKVRILSEDVGPGDHVLTMEHVMSTNVQFSSNGRVRSAFWIRDLRDRLFLEQYVPSNLEFDQYPMTLELNFVGMKKFNQDFRSNGTVTKIGDNSWRIEYPAWYTVACPFFHTFPTGSYYTQRFTIRSIDGRNVPITVYTSSSASTQRFATYIKEVFAELEKDYGPWGHPQLTVYGAGGGGMEHPGATMASIQAVDHEMLHSYFAKGVMPSSGNSGWIDEGIASWRDNGYPRNLSTSLQANLAGRSPYARNTDDRCYKVGSALFAYIDNLMQNTGGFKAFLRGYFATYKYTGITTEHFINNLEFFSGLSLTEIFKQHVYIDPPQRMLLREPAQENPNHPALTVEQLRALL